MYNVRLCCKLHLSFSLNHLLLAPLLQLLLRRKQLLRRRHYNEREHRRKARDRQRVLRSYRRCGKSRYKVHFRCTFASFLFSYPPFISLVTPTTSTKKAKTTKTTLQGEGTQKEGERQTTGTRKLQEVWKFNVQGTFSLYIASFPFFYSTLISHITPTTTNEENNYHKDGTSTRRGITEERREVDNR